MMCRITCDVAAATIKRILRGRRATAGRCQFEQAGIWNPARFKALRRCYQLNPMEDAMGRGILLWLLGIPIPIIILLALLWH